MSISIELWKCTATAWTKIKLNQPFVLVVHLCFKRRMMRKYLWTFLTGLGIINCQSQTPIGFSGEMPIQIDTLYFPYYDDLQMIEVDHEGYEMRGLKLINTESFPKDFQFPLLRVLNEYIFRNKNGEVVKAFNSPQSLADLTKHFNSNEKNAPSNFITHKKRETQKLKSARFNHHYLVTNFVEKRYQGDVSKEKALPNFGLIDSLGNLKIKANFETLIPIGNEILARKRNLYGIIDYNENEILSFEFDSYLDDFEGFMNKDYLVFTKGLNYFQHKPSKILVGVYDKTTKLFKPLDAYHSIDLSRDQQIIPVYKYGKLGFLDSNFNEILPPTYEMSDFNFESSGLFRVAQNGKYGFIYPNGTIAIPLEYDYATPFNRDSITLTLKNGKFKCFNSKGKKTRKCDLKPDWKIIKDEIQNDFQLLKNNQNGTNALFYLVENEFVIPFQIGDIYTTNNVAFSPTKFYQFRNHETNKIGIVNLNTKQKSAVIFDYVREVYDDLLIVGKDKLEGLIDQNFTTIFDFKYPELRFSQVNPRHLYFRNDKYQYGIIDLNEQIIIPPSTTYLHSNPNYTKTQKEYLFGVLDKNGQELIPTMYDEIEDFGSNNLLIVSKNKKYGVVNYQNEIIVPIEYDIVYPAHHSASREGFITVYKRIIEYGISTGETKEILIEKKN